EETDKQNETLVGVHADAAVVPALVATATARDGFRRRSALGLRRVHGHPAALAHARLVGRAVAQALLVIPLELFLRVLLVHLHPLARVAGAAREHTEGGDQDEQADL